MHTIPNRVNIAFKVDDLPALKDRIYRIIWASISICHIRDQYFASQVRTLRDDIKEGRVKSFKQFLNVVSESGLNQYCVKTIKGSFWGGSHSVMHRLWWSRIWTKIQYGDIEIIEK